VGGGAGVGTRLQVPMKSTHEMKVSGFLLGAQVPTPLISGDPAGFVKGSVFLPTLLKSLQVFPVFQTNRPTATSVGHTKEDGTCHFPLRLPCPKVPERQKRICGCSAMKYWLRSLSARSKCVQFTSSLIVVPHAIWKKAWPPWSAVSLKDTSMSEPGVSTGTSRPLASYHFCQTSRPRELSSDEAPHIEASALFPA